MTDREAIRRIRMGEIDTFSYLVHKYSKRIESYVRLKLSRKDDADDIVQETFLKLYRSIDTFDIEKPVLPYLFAIAKNELKMHWRKQKETVSLNEELVTASKEEKWGQEDIGTFLRPLLPPERRALLMISEGYSYQEVARTLSKPLNTIRTIIRRARLKLMRLQKI